MRIRTLRTSTVLALLVAAFPGETRAAPAFTAFESGQVRPIALSPDGTRLFAVNTPDNRLEIYAVTARGLRHVESVPVGLEPVAVAARNSDEVWVVNHLSDSVSIVDVSGLNAEVERTLLVGDEPRDIVFAGPGKSRAFITAAHRGQNTGFDPQNTTPGVGRADVWVFNANNLGSALGGQPLTRINLFSDVPRALAVSPDGDTVYAASFMSGNQTTVVGPHQITNDGEQAGGIPGPNVNHAGVPEANVGLIVKWDGEHWVDELGRPWDDHIKFNLPDRDVFVIDAGPGVPQLKPGGAGSGFFTGVGTVLFNMIVNPSSGRVYVTNTEARNEVRFEGPGEFAATTVRGHMVDTQISVLGGGGTATRQLNKHINYNDCCAERPNEENELSVSQPNGMAITADGSTLYVAVLGNDKVVVYDTEALEDDSFYPDAGDQIAVSGGGPTGVVLDEQRDRLYVLTRFDNGISIIDTDTREETGHVTMHNPEPPSLVQGRRFLYDASYTSSHGDSACATCHIFGDNDQLAWDLGDPDLDVVDPPNILKMTLNPAEVPFHPMKGPMTTQSLRGMANHGAMHWRGDRNGEGQGANVQPDGGAYSERAAFKAFNVAFEGLLGRDEPLTEAEMDAFTEFVLQITYPPNPHRALDNTLTASQQAGHEFFTTRLTFAVDFRCVDCHVLDPNGNAQYGVEHPGFFGSDGQLVGGEFSQTFKVPHLRNIYTKIGMFGMAHDPQIHDTTFVGYDPSHQGDQVRGFGITHDGTIDSVQRFMGAFSAGPLNGPDGFHLRQEQLDVAEFLFAFDTNLKPIVGQQITLRPNNSAVVGPRIDLLMDRADAGECELIAKASVLSVEFGAVYTGNGNFTTSLTAVGTRTDAQLRQLATMLHNPVTYTCVPPGSGYRLGVDRDGDGHRDADELLHASDPADPSDTP
ncbi:hypothetical protein [Nannocystis radixulma]|uniref:Cytochrome c domain-containing protein n=1 Tax=Nannocystis radixulma TaxID=2995305 RepID=A0ABT5BLI5_9BACT|nr:hypothetical protein [Nannocystis radixulma]MDC0674440.1 hypothetical protein [Nannocystis radixulma]